MHAYVLPFTLALTGLLATSPALAADPNGPIGPTATGRVLAGLSTDPNQAGADKAGVLGGYTKKTAQLWDTFEKQIGQPMRDWAKTELRRTPGETIFYPFAGPDFPTAQLLYPEAGRYVLVALQKGGRVPDLQALPKDKANTYLKTFRAGWESFTLRGFYDTDDLKRDTGKASILEGITPAFMAFAVRLGYTITDIQPIRISASGDDVEVHPGDKGAQETWDSVRLSLRSAAGKAVLLDYVFLDLSDTNLKKHDNERRWIERMATNRVVTKAASHLMQKPFFSVVKSAILKSAPTVFQDETGIDYGELSAAFEVTLYGKFTKANKLFIEGIQRSLAKAYKERKDIKPLPFKVGYKKESGSCLQIAVRKTP
ncbi:MAG: hypothetical protein JNJ59_11695 [Deltaproteobacteria bacterium]|jgi:hypothetical protein|nr:hypothetical protein [Deltaproteobacteria bacterium]